MSTLISTEISQDLYTIIETTHTDNTVDKAEYHIGDLVENLRYIEKEEIKTITGKIKAFNINIKKYAKVSSLITRYQEDTFSDDVELISIVIDASSHYRSNLVTVTAKEIVENVDVTDVKSVKSVLKLEANIKQTYDDNNVTEVRLVPGMMISNIVIKNTVAGKANIEGSYKFNKFVYNKDNNTNTGLVIKSIVISNSKLALSVSIDRIVSISGEMNVADNTDSITEILSDESSTGVSISALKYTDAINIEKDFSITGANYGAVANTGKRATSYAVSGETILSGPISIGNSSNVIIDGVTFTGKAELQINNASRVVLKNCRFVSMKPEGGREYLITGLTGDNDVKLEIENCYFGDVDVDAIGKIYNLFELNTKLADGSYIRNNRFSIDQSTHNIINIYEVAENATITIEGNTFEYSANAIRVGIKGSPKCNIDILKNIYLATDKDYPEYAGLLLIQPYGMQTDSFANCTITLKGNINRSGVSQLYYTYAGPNDTQFNNFNTPTIILNGKIVQEPKIVG